MTGNTGGFNVGFVGWMMALLAGAAAMAGSFEALTMIIIVGAVVMWVKAIARSL